MKNKTLKTVVAGITLSLTFSFSANAQWLTTGNTVSSTPILGINSGLFPLNIKTVPAQPISFFTTGIQRATILAGGNFGIGTTAPQHLFEVNGGFSNFTYNSAALPPSMATGGLTVGWNKSAGGAEVNLYNVYNNATKSFVFSQKTGASTSVDLMTILGSGNVGIGTNTPNAKLHLFESALLGSTAGNSILITKLSGNVGTGNTFQSNLWLYRKTAGSAWQSSVLHDGISIDTYNTAPGTNTLTWWERDPNNGMQSWGTNATTQMVLQNGNLGLGTNGAPTYHLDVRGGNTVGTVASFSNSSTGTYPTLFLSNSSGNGNYNPLTKQFDNGIFWSDASGGNGTANGFVIAPWGSSSNGMRIDGGTGNVGIATNTPAAKLDVNGQVYCRDVLSVFNDVNGGNLFVQKTSASNSPNFNIGVPSWGGGSAFIDLNNADATNADLFVNTWTCRNTHINCDNWGTIPSNGLNGGTVFLGKTELHVNSTINPNAITVKDISNGKINFLVKTTGVVYAREIFVQATNFPDYVFKPGYHLMPLNEVVAYVKTNSHLPNVPAAAEVEEKGANLGEIQKANIEKTEEIYLYLFELNKKIEKLEQENKELKAAINKK